MRNKRHIGKLEGIIFSLLGFLWAISCIFPIWKVFCATFSKETTNLTTVLLPDSFSNGVSKMYTALTSVNVMQATADTAVYTLIAIVGMLIMCSLASYEFSFYNFPGKKILFSVLMGAMMLPFILYVVPLYRFVYKLGLTDTYIGVAIPIMISPMSVFILNQFSETIPASLIESARIDGASHFQIFFRIYLPLVRNGLITVTVLMFLRAWGSYMWPALVTGNSIMPVSRTIANLLSKFFYVDVRVKMAAMLLAMIPPMTIYVLFQKHVIEGMTMSSVKG